MLAVPRQGLFENCESQTTRRKAAVLSRTDRRPNDAVEAPTRARLGRAARTRT